MSIAVESQIYENFKGIREYNGVNAAGQISALICNNVELVQSEIGSGTSIRSMDGNAITHTLPQGYSIIEVFETEQEGLSYQIIYAENETKGTLFYIGIDNTLKVLLDNLTVTGVCNGLTMSSSAFDVFVFTNGQEVRTICFTIDTAYRDMIQDHNPIAITGGGYIATITPIDYLGRSLHWLSMTDWNGFLVVASEYGVHSSHQNDIYTWNDDPQDVADSWYIDFSKKITAVSSFTGGLYIFTQDDCSLLTNTPNDTANSVLRTSAGVGCFSYTSLVKHDTFLFFYDNRQRNVYYLNATDTTGQTRPSGPVAKEIQSYFTNIKRFKMYSCIYNTRNEIWCLIDNNILIFDYAQQEWVTRQEQSINTICLVNNTIQTGDVYGNIRIEGVNEDYSGMYYPSVYKTTYINIGSNTNVKKQKTPLLFTLNSNYTNDFYVQLICNGKEKNPKHIVIKNNKASVYDEGKYDITVFAPEGTYNKTVVEVSTPQTWYTLGVKIFTSELGQGFYINSMELKNIKAKTKTRGR